MSRPARVTLRVDGVLVGSASGTISNTFSNATVLLGEGSNPAPASDFAWDDTHLWRGGSDMLANTGFESGLVTPDGAAVSVGGWRPNNSTRAARVTSPVYAGTSEWLVASPAPTTGAHAMRALLNGTSSRANLDGTLMSAATGIGTGQSDGVTLGTVDCIPLTMDCTAVHVDQLGA